MAGLLWKRVHSIFSGVSMKKNSGLSASGSEAEVGHISSRLIHDGRVVHLSVDLVRFPDGREGELEFIRHRGASAVVPLLGEPEDPDPYVVLIRQYRYATGGVVYEIPAGIPEEGEGWEACARRELEEETGYRGAHFKPLTELFTTPGFTNELIHFFLATGLTPGEVNRDEDEYIEVVNIPFSEALALIQKGEIRDGKSVSGLLFVDRFLRGGN
jgi:ADP-ribose pyrophosphatase